MMRLFTGISIPPPVLNTLMNAMDQLRRTASLQWSAPENLHITTKFIGQWPEERLDELKRALGAMPTPAPFQISVGHFGFFPNPHHPHTFFAGVRTGTELTSLSQRLDATLQELGMQPEKREYLPHVTLGKIKNEDIQQMREWIAGNGSLEFGVFQAKEFHLYLSRDSKYTVLESFPLGAKELAGK